MGILDDKDPWPYHRVLLRRTLEDMRWISHPAIGAVIYPAGAAKTNDLSQKLSFATAASVLGIRVAHAERTYKDVLPEPTPQTAEHDAFISCYRLAARHLEEARARFRSSPEADLTLGVFAASIALQRIDDTLSSAHILYQLGQQLEGDAIARYMLEQIAWAYTAFPAVSHEELDKIKSHAAISSFKKISPGAGVLYGSLSRSTHAGNSTHRAWFDITPDGKGVVTVSKQPGLTQAATLLELADMYVLALEASQNGHMLSYEAIDPATGSALPGRAFLSRAQDALDHLRVTIGTREE